MKTKKIDLSIILLNYNTEHYLMSCVASIFKETKGISYEIIVADNNSKGGVKKILEKQYPEVIYLDMGYNAGFARGNNAGIRIAKGEYILLLNDDTIIQDNALAKALIYLKEVEKNHDIGFMCIKLMNDDRTLQKTTHQEFTRFEEIALPSPLSIILNRERKKTDKKKFLENLEENHEAEWVSGAFLMANADRYFKDNLFLDEDFLIYTEDVEVCKRARAMDYKNIHFAGASIFHINSASYSVERKSGQLTISQWLYLYKTEGLTKYWKLIFNNYLSIMTQNVYYIKNMIFGKVSDADRESKKNLKEILNLLKRYGWTIPFKYNRNTSSSKNFLKYTKK